MLEPYPGRYLAAVADDIIMLDLDADEYSAAPPALADLIRSALAPETARSVPPSRIERLIEARILIDMPARTTPYELPTAPEPGGLKNLSWRPSGGPVIAAPAATTWSTTLRATWLLRRANRLVDRGISDVIADLRRRARTSVNPTQGQELENLVEAHIRARMIYSRPTQCLAAATAFASHAWLIGADVEFVIGVQSRPFYAHAWVERAGVVLNDVAEVNRKLAPILRIPAEPEARRS